jgi:hypothetical protein
VRTLIYTRFIVIVGEEVRVFSPRVFFSVVYIATYTYT